jgi:hypothetical protein
MDDKPAPKPELPTLPLDHVYRELAEDTRYHLGWRERLLLGFVAIPGALALLYDKPASSFRWIVPLSGFILSMAVFYLEERCHAILLDRRDAGTVIEKGADLRGIFTSADDMSIGHRPSHTDILRVLYMLGAVSFAGWALKDFLHTGWLRETCADLAILALFVGVISLPLAHAVVRIFREEKKQRKRTRA